VGEGSLASIVGPQYFWSCLHTAGKGCPVPQGTGFLPLVGQFLLLVRYRSLDVKNVRCSVERLRAFGHAYAQGLGGLWCLGGGQSPGGGVDVKGTPA